MLVWLSIFVVAVSALWWRERRKYRSLNHLPGPRPWPILGNVADVASPDTGAFFKKMRHWASCYKDIYVLWLIHKPVINIYHPDDVEVVLSSSTLITKSILYRFAEPWLFTGLLTTDGAKWHNRRKMLIPAFHFRILKEFLVGLEENSWKLVSRLQSELGNDQTDIRSFIGKYTLDSICETSMGTKLDEELDKGRKYMEGVDTVANILFDRMSRLWLHNDLVFSLSSFGKQNKKALQDVHGFTQNVIEKRRQYVKENGIAFSEQADISDAVTTPKRRLALLDLLLQLEKEDKIDASGIHEEVETFMFGGHDTTYAAITFLFLLLANHQEYQNRVYDELVETLGTSPQPASMDDLNKLTFLKACIKETLRLFPSGPFIGRLITHDVQLKSCHVPAGTTCNIHIFDLHRRADFWDDPLSFRPERFLDEELQNCRRHPYAYVPFSAGLRNCIGQKYAMLQIMSAAAAVLRTFRLLAVTRPHDVQLRADAVLRPHSPAYVTLRSRSSPPSKA